MPKVFIDFVETLKKVVAEEFPNSKFQVQISESECVLSEKEKSCVLRSKEDRLDLYFFREYENQNRGADLHYKLDNGEARLDGVSDDSPVTYGYIVRDCIGFLLEPENREHDG